MDAADRQRKKNWKAHERSAARGAFPLPDELMQSLFDHVRGAVEDQGCDHSRRFTDRWLSDHEDRRERVIAWLNENRGFCDCEVVANAADHWEQYR
jgi:hypothetical protein